MEGHLCYAALLGALGWVRGRHRPGVRPTTGAATVTGNTSFADARDGDNNTATSTGRPTGSTSQFGNDRAVLTDIRRRIPCQRHRPRRKREVKAILDQSASDNDRKYLLHSTFENEGHQGGPAHEPLGWPCLQAHRSRSNPPASRERARTWSPSSVPAPCSTKANFSKRPVDITPAKPGESTETEVA